MVGVEELSGGSCERQGTTAQGRGMKRLVGVHALQHFSEFFHVPFRALHCPPAVQIRCPGWSLGQCFRRVFIEYLGHEGNQVTNNSRVFE